MNNDHLEQGKQLFYKAYYKKALEEFEKALLQAKSDEELAEIYSWMGRYCYSYTQYDDAIIYYKQALQLNPEIILYHTRLGHAYLKTNNKTEADRIFQEILKQECKTADDYFGHGLIKDYKQDYDDAIADYTRAIEINPEYIDAYNNRGNAKFHHKDYDVAVADYTRAIEINPEYVEAYSNRGSAKYHNKDYDGAIADYTRAIEINPEYADVYYNRGLVKYDKQDYDDAIADYTQAIALNPAHAEAYSNRGGVKYLKQNYKGAIKDAEEALRLDPKLEQAKSLKILAEAKQSQEEFKLSKTRYDALAYNIRKSDDEFEIRQKKYEDDTKELIQEVNELKKKSETLLKDVTAKGLSEIYSKQARWQFFAFIGLKILEIIIYGTIIWYLYHEGFDWLERLLEAETLDASRIIFTLFIKISIFIPVYLLIYSIQQTAYRFSQRAELDGDTASQWSFYHKMELELKELKDNPDYTELHKNFMEQNIALRQKTNFELLEEIMAKRSDKTPSLKQIDALADTAKKIKDVCTPSTPTDGDNKKS